MILAGSVLISALVFFAYPMSPTTRNKRGIDNCEWIQIGRALYDSCIDPADYRGSSA
jgi:hypothetical protein